MTSYGFCEMILFHTFFFSFLTLLHFKGLPEVFAHPRADDIRTPLEVHGKSVSCPVHCRCPDLGSVMDCQRSGISRVPFSFLPPSVIILDLDHNRIGRLTNGSFGDATPGFNDKNGQGTLSSLSSTHLLLEILSLQDNGLVRIEAGALFPLSELRVLRLGLNQLSSLDPDLFENNRRLQVLDLHANYLTSLPDHVMYHLHSLETLNISFNHLSAPLVFGPGFRYTTQLSNIDLTGNDLVRIEMASLAVMQAWDPNVSRHMNLSYCNIRALNSKAFHPVPSLCTLSLQGNDRLPPGQLQEALKDLAQQQWSPRTVDFSRMNLTDLTELFRRFQPNSLWDMNLSNNGIQTVPKQAFLFMSNLRQLDLSHNDIAIVENLAGLSKLEQLSVAFNRLDSLDERTFEGLHAVKSLDLSHNTLTSVHDRPLLNLFNLHTIDISCNQIEQVNIGGGGLESLRTFRAAANRLYSLKFLRRLRRLRYVDVSLNIVTQLDDEVFARGLTAVFANFSNNAITTIGADAFVNVNFNVLDLSRNRLTHLAHHGWMGVKRLYAHDNLITHVDDSFFGTIATSTIQELHLQRNDLTELNPRFFVELLRAKLIDLSFNRGLGDALDSVLVLTGTGGTPRAVPSFTGGQVEQENDVTSLSRLETLRLRQIGMTTVPVKLLTSLTSLRVLDLSRNHLTSLGAKSFASLTQLRELNLAYNAFVQFDAFDQGLTLSGAPAIKFVDLSGNRWDCTCGLHSICSSFYSIPSSSPSSSDNKGMTTLVNANNRASYACQTPTEKMGMSLREFCDTVAVTQCRSSPYSDVIAVALAVITTALGAAFLAAVCVAVVVRRHWRRGDRGAFSVIGEVSVASGPSGGRRKAGVAGRGRSCDVRYQPCADETSLTSCSNTNSTRSPSDVLMTLNGDSTSCRQWTWRDTGGGLSD